MRGNAAPPFANQPRHDNSEDMVSPEDPRQRLGFLVANMLAEKAQQSLPWYDSNWLRCFVAAVETIERIRPQMRAPFIDAFARLRTPSDFSPKKLDRVFDAATMELIVQTIKTLPPARHETHEVERFGRTVVHDHPVFDELQRTLIPRVSELAGEELEPSYNFASLYSRLGVCEPHMDAPEAKRTLDLCVDQSESWPLHLSQIVPWPADRSYAGGDWQERVKRLPDLEWSSHSLRPGESLFVAGRSHWHYRDRLPHPQANSFCTLLFFHFLPKGMKEIVRPENWPSRFGIPELAGTVGLVEFDKTGN